MKVVQLLDLQGPWQSQVFRDTDCLCSRSYGPISHFFEPLVYVIEGLFGQSFSIAPPIQAPLLCLLCETHLLCYMQLRFVLFHCHIVFHCVQLPPFMFLFSCFECYKICLLMSICVLFVLFYYTLFFIAALESQ